MSSVEFKAIIGYAVIALLLLGAWLLNRRDGIRLRDMLRAPADRRLWRWIALAVPLLAFALTAYVTLFYALSWVAPEFVRSEILGPDESLFDSARPLLSSLGVAAAVFFGPAAEEIFFRGALLRRWTSRWGFGKALVASSLLFGALHTDLIGAVAFGVCMGLLACRARTLLLPIAVHVLHNGLIYAGDALTADDATFQTLAEFRAELFPLVLAFVPMAAVMALIIGRLYRSCTSSALHNPRRLEFCDEAIAVRAGELGQGK